MEGNKIAALERQDKFKVSEVDAWIHSGESADSDE